MFALFRDGLPVPGGCSSLRTLSRPSPEYIPHRKRSVTGQMGLGFSLTAAASPENPAPSARAEICVAEVLRRPTHKLTLGVPMTGTLIDKGVYVLPAEGHDSRRMDAAVPADMPGKANSFFMLFDFGRETVGFPRIEFDLPAGGPCLVGWGEHVTDGRCRTAIGSRDFSFSCEAAAGHSLFFPALRRIGCRYVEIFFPAEPSSVKVELVPAEYPVRQLPPPSFSSREKGPDGASAARRERIYDTAVQTLRCCMHEHYEDCPWREQALYANDARNQILCGRHAFDENGDFAALSLELLARGLRSDGWLGMCMPARIEFTIPSFTFSPVLTGSKTASNPRPAASMPWPQQSLFSRLMSPLASISASCSR